MKVPQAFLAFDTLLLALTLFIFMVILTAEVKYQL
jgi:hypothetical protein